MNGPLSGKVVVITGGGRGLGRAMALGMARAGAAGITITAARREDELRAVAGEIAAVADADIALPLVADVADAAACERVVAETTARFGRLDVLVNNAGRGQGSVGDDRIPFWENDRDGWMEVVATNVNGPFLMAWAAVRPMIERGWGRIINISKSLDSMHRGRSTPYGPTKAALEAMTLAWAQELEGTGVTVNTLAPGGGVDTTFVLPAVRRRLATEKRRYLPPEIVVPAALWLASEASDGITGCRFVGRKWRDDLPPDEAAEQAREPAIFRPPGRDTILTRTWQPPIPAAKER